MAVYKNTNLKFYWSSDPCLHVPIISDKITSKQFKNITENFHFNDNTQTKPRGESGFHKLLKL